MYIVARADSKWMMTAIIRQPITSITNNNIMQHISTRMLFVVVVIAVLFILTSTTATHAHNDNYRREDTAEKNT